MFGKKDGMDGGEGMSYPRKSAGRFVLVVIIAVVAIFAAWKVLVMYGVLPSGNFPAVSGGTWQAVFLNNNQVYFGHLKGYNDNYATLSDIYYLQVASPLQQGATQQPSLNLVKLGSELHGPQDTMYIPQNEIMFWENMRSDSAIVQAINNHIAQQK